jgi:hypothetical protein
MGMDGVSISISAAARIKIVTIRVTEHVKVVKKFMDMGPMGA